MSSTWTLEASLSSDMALRLANSIVEKAVVPGALSRTFCARIRWCLRATGKEPAGTVCRKRVRGGTNLALSYHHCVEVDCENEFHSRRSGFFGTRAQYPRFHATGSVGNFGRPLQICNSNSCQDKIGPLRSSSSQDLLVAARLSSEPYNSDSAGAFEDGHQETGESGGDSVGDNHEQFAVVNFYHFTDIDNPHEEVARHSDFMKGRNIRCRIYINEQGINAQLSGPVEDVLAYGEWVQADSRFEGMTLQVSPSPVGHAFPRLKLRYKPALVQVEGGTSQLPLADPSQRAVALTPLQWKQRLESAQFIAPRSAHPVAADHATQTGEPMGEESTLCSKEGSMGPEGRDGGNQGRRDAEEGSPINLESGSGNPFSVEGGNKVLLLDVRNGYEWDVGHFQNAARPDVDSFRTTDFGMAADEKVSSQDPLAHIDRESTDVLMYCTGGIRCDVYSTMLRRRGFKNLYTLQGGVARYLKEEGTEHWAGSLFVFDSRLAVTPSLYKAGQALVEGGESDSTSQVAAAKGTESGTGESNFAKCTLCGDVLETVRHRNCANLDCNKLFLVCGQCAVETQGSCSDTCQQAPRLRPFLEGARPYARWHNYRPPAGPAPDHGVIPGRAVKRQERRQRLAKEKAQVDFNPQESQ